MKKRTLFGFVAVVALLLGVNPEATAVHTQSDGVWITHTNGNYVNDIAYAGTQLWAATSGGVVHWDTNSGTHVKYTTRDGLASNSVQAVAIDPTGDKWFGTEAGVSKFDGSSWTTYETTNAGLSGDSVRAVALDGSGAIWFACYDQGNKGQGVVRFDGTTWTVYDTSNSGLPSDAVTSVTYDGVAHMWFATERYYDNGWVGGGVASFDGAHWTTYTASNSGLVNDSVRALAIDLNGDTWFGTSAGVSRFDGTTWTTFNTSNAGLVDDHVQAVAIDPDGHAWFGTYYGGVSEFDGNSWTAHTTSNSGLMSDSVRAIAVDHGGDKWFGTERGLSAFDDAAWTSFVTPDGLTSNVEAVLVDHQDNMWFTSSEGVSRYDGTTWTTYDSSNSGLVADWVKTVAEGVDGHKWFGTSFGASEFDGKTWTTYTTDNSGLPDNNVNSIVVDEAGNVWFGTYWGGAAKFDGSTWITFNPANSGLGGHRVEDIAVDGAGHVWFSSLEPVTSSQNALSPMFAEAQGVQAFDGLHWTSFTQANSGLVSDWVWDIAVDELNRKWFATWGGVSRFDGSTWTSYRAADSGLADDYVYTMAVDPDGRTWFGYGWGDGGVTEYDGTTWTTYTTSSSGLASDWVNAIAIDAHGHTWFGTDGGVSEYISDGTSGEITVAHGGSIASSDGRVTLTFPPHTVSEDVDIRFAPIKPDVTGGMRDIGQSYQLQVVPAGTSGPSVDTVAGAYTVVTHYAEDDVGPIDESTLALYHWDGSQWVKEPSSTVNPAANTVTATPNHFSQWAVLGRARTGQPGLSFRYVETFGETQEAYFPRTDHLNGPNGLFIDGDDQLYVAEELGARVLKYRTSSGAPNLLSIGIAGYQSEGESSFNHPQDVAVDSEGNIWTVDQHRVAQFDANGIFQQQLPAEEPWVSGTGNDRFDGPKGIAFDSEGRFYVADSYNHRIQVYTFDIGGTPVYSATIGVTDEPGDDNAHFSKPAQIVFDSSDRLYVTDVDNYRVQQCTYAGGWTCQPFHGTGAPGSGDDQLNLAYGIGIDEGDTIYIGDGINARVKTCTTGGSCTTFAAAAGWPADIAVDSKGHVYVSDYYDHTIREYDSGGTDLGVLKGTHDTPYFTDDSHFNAPHGVAVDASGNLFVTEYDGHRLIKLSAEGTPQWSVGEPGVWGDDDEHFGGLWDGPSGLAVDSEGNAYVADPNNHRVQVCTPSGSCTTFAGVPGESGCDDDHFDDLFGVTVDGDGNVYVADRDNHRVQKCTPSGDCATFAGITGAAGDDAEHFNGPVGVAVDGSDNVYVADAWNHRVQWCTPTGSCTTFAGTTGFWGDDFEHFSEPRDVAVDMEGRVYVADIYNNRVQVFDSSGGYLTTIGGTWGLEAGRISHAAGVAVDAGGNVYVADHVNHRVQRFALGVPGWRQANVNGFGDRDNWGAWSLGTFEDALYVSTGNHADGADVYRLASGSWEQVVSAGFGDEANVAVDWFAEFKGDLYASTWNDTGNGSNGGQIWRSPTGDSGTWCRVVNDGFGDATNAEVMSLSVFDGYLYAGTWSGDTGVHGAEIWRSPTGEADSWELVVGDAEFGDSDNVAIMSFEVFDGDLYAATYNEASGGGVWRAADGTTWSQVNEDGFGTVDNASVVSLEVFSDRLYAGTWNSAEGGAIWRTRNGTTWDPVVGGGFGSVDNKAIGSLIAFDGDLYAVVGNDETGPEVWRSSSGAGGSWGRVADTAFGCGAGDAVYWDTMTAVFENSLYVGTSTRGNSGGRVWQMLQEVHLPLVIRGR